jgi:hypothetical protein
VSGPVQVGDLVVIVIVIVGEKVSAQASRTVDRQACECCAVWVRHWRGRLVLGYDGRAWFELGQKAPVQSAQSREWVDLKRCSKM